MRHLLHHSEIDLIDDILITSQGMNSIRMVQCISKIMELALTFTAESSEERIDVKDALNELKKIKVRFLSKWIVKRYEMLFTSTGNITFTNS